MVDFLIKTAAELPGGPLKWAWGCVLAILFLVGTSMLAYGRMERAPNANPAAKPTGPSNRFLKQVLAWHLVLLAITFALLALTAYTWQVTNNRQPSPTGYQAFYAISATLFLAGVVTWFGARRTK